MISVVLPTHNRKTRGFLKESIESVLKQDHKDFELLIIDDGSTDGTSELCKLYASREAANTVRYIYQKNGGVSSARNNGIRCARGEYVAFLDDDDIWLPQKLSEQMNLIESRGDDRFGLCYTALELITEQSARTGEIQSLNADGFVFREMLYKNLVVCTSSVIVPKKIFDVVGFFDESSSHAEDYDLWLRISKKYNIYSIDKPLVLYRRHKNKLSQDLDKIEQNSLCAVKAVMQGLSEAEQNMVLNANYRRRAAYRLWREEYVVFRQHIRKARLYGPVGLDLRLRFFLSYFPCLIKFARRLKAKIKRLTSFLLLGSIL